MEYILEKPIISQSLCRFEETSAMPCTTGLSSRNSLEGWQASYLRPRADTKTLFRNIKS